MKDKNKVSNDLDLNNEKQNNKLDTKKSNNNTENSSDNQESHRDANQINSSKNTSLKINFLMDVPVNLTIELGTVKIKIKDLLALCSESVLVLDKYAGEPLNILINGHIIATGELVVIDDKYGIKIVNIFNNSQYLNNLK